MNKLFVIKIFSSAFLGGMAEWAGNAPNQGILAIACFSGLMLLIVSISKEKDGK